MSLIMILYLTCVCCNFFKYKYLSEKLQRNQERKCIFFLFMFSGPILLMYVAYKGLQRKAKRRKRKKEIYKAVKDQLPKILEKYNITIEES